MEALPAIPDDSSSANPSSAKSDSGSSRHDSGRGSPPPNCAICLGTCRNKSFTDSCLHQFCFKCLLTWSKVKAECPLCKQNFKSIIHNVRSNHQYEEYMVEQRQADEVTERADVENLRTVTRRFRYSTTFTLPRHESIAIQQLLMHYPLMAGVGVLPPPRRRRSPASFRRTVYRHNLWARPLPDFTGRFRDSTPDFYRYNDTQMHRLVPWLNRELSYLLNDNVGHISYVMTRIMDLLPQYHITSPEFRDAMRRYFGERTEHFLHELYCFASTPYDMTGYDRNVQYTTDSRISTMVNEVISSSESEASVDSDIVMVSSSGPSFPPPPAPPPLGFAPGPSGVNQANIIPIETISHSDTDDDSSDVMVVGYIKPPQERTPEVVDLLGSDSDVVVQEGSGDAPSPPAPPAPPDAGDAAAAGAADGYVKLTLKRHARAEDSDSDASYRPPAARRRRRARSRGSDTTVDTRASTPLATSPVSSVSGFQSTDTGDSTPLSTLLVSPLNSPFNSPLASPVITSQSAPPTTSPVSSVSGFLSTDTGDSSEGLSDDESDSVERRPRFTRKKTKKRGPRRDRKRSDRRTSRNRRADRRAVPEDRAEKKVVPEENGDRERRSKRKSHAGKGVKCSKRKEETTPARSPERPGECEVGVQAGPSGCARRRRRGARDSRRLRSVVSVVPGAGGAGAAGAAGAGAAGAGGAAAGASSDSDDNLPLNLTVQKAHLVS